ncbi:MAG TPA: hypothetical protein PJ997_02445 [Candidatus Paceibacterota bacterium]|nr:hypothetical protein [Candidatus Paceibacterota bacterium]HMP19172.1 hypothetical protein [Candidatus Paceibacterota bacterium]HMP85223.1 hypothetical protein [Candidatus Paceibacterota bacterium]
MTEQNFKTSFIPSKPIQPIKKGGDLPHDRGSSILTIISTVIFLSVLVISGGVYVYKISLDSKVKEQFERIKQIEANLEPPFVKDATRMNSKIKNIKFLFENHVAPSQMIALLERATRATLQFNSFSYKRDADGSALVTINGQARGFETIVLQSDSYSQTKFMKDILFTGLQPGDQDRGVRFNLTTIVDRALISYKEKVAQQQTNN